jgi:hypothetical protein
MVALRVIDVVDAADTAAQGEILRARILPALRTGDQLRLSFDGIVSATSSFVNSAFVETLHSIPFDRFKAQVRIVDATGQITEMIRTRMTREAERLQPAGH